MAEGRDVTTPVTPPLATRLGIHIISIRNLGKYTLFSMKVEICHFCLFLFSIRSIFNKTS
jgi:hypothetical protein